MSTPAEKLQKLVENKQHLIDIINGKADTSFDLNSNLTEIIDTINELIKITDATASASDILAGKVAYNNDGKVVGTIKNYDYSYSDLIKLITYIEGQTTITEGQYAGCEDTETVIPKTITTIENNAFMNCTELTKVTKEDLIYTPDEFTVGKNIFEGCNKLETLEFPTAWKSFNYLAELFGGESNSTYLPEALKNITLTMSDSDDLYDAEVALRVLDNAQYLENITVKIKNNETNCLSEGHGGRDWGLPIQDLSFNPTKPVNIYLPGAYDNLGGGDTVYWGTVSGFAPSELPEEELDYTFGYNGAYNALTSVNLTIGPCMSDDGFILGSFRNSTLNKLNVFCADTDTNAMYLGGLSCSWDEEEDIYAPVFGNTSLTELTLKAGNFDCIPAGCFENSTKLRRINLIATAPTESTNTSGDSNYLFVGANAFTNMSTDVDTSELPIIIYFKDIYPYFVELESLHQLYNSQNGNIALVFDNTANDDCYFDYAGDWDNPYAAVLYECGYTPESFEAKYHINIRETIY